MYQNVHSPVSWRCFQLTCNPKKISNCLHPPNVVTYSSYQISPPTHPLFTSPPPFFPMVWSCLILVPRQAPETESPSPNQRKKTSYTSRTGWRWCMAIFSRFKVLAGANELKIYVCSKWQSNLVICWQPKLKKIWLKTYETKKNQPFPRIHFFV